MKEVSQMKHINYFHPDPIIFLCWIHTLDVLIAIKWTFILDQMVHLHEQLHYIEGCSWCHKCAPRRPWGVATLSSRAEQWLLVSQWGKCFPIGLLSFAAKRTFPLMSMEEQFQSFCLWTLNVIKVCVKLESDETVNTIWK